VGNIIHEEIARALTDGDLTMDIVSATRERISTMLKDMFRKDDLDRAKVIRGPYINNTIVKLDRRGIRSGRLDGCSELNRTLVDLAEACCLNGIGDVRGLDRTEKATFRAGRGRDGDGGAFELCLERERVVERRKRAS
jgi:hypothetical protein